MQYEEVKGQILKDKYIDFAYERYLYFKETPMYDEKYKWETLEELNEYFQMTPINETTVVDLAKKIQESNPTSGSFVHWNNTSSLVEHAEQRPKEIAELWRQLYDGALPLKDRIATFHERAKEFDESLALGAPLYGYLLAAYDYTRYPLYKGEIYKEIIATYEISQKFGSVSENYSVYFMICEIILAYLSEKDSDITMLDIQDFLYCSNRYNKVKVESAADYLADLAKTLHQFKEDPNLLLKAIMSLEHHTLHELREIYRDSEKVRKIRFMVIDKILEEGTVNLSDVENMKEEVSAQYDTKILNSYNNFTILFHLYYYDKREKVLKELGKIHQAIRQFSALKEFELVENKTLNGFNWNQSFGGSESWLAVYEAKYTTHREAPQFFVRIDENGMLMGLVHGDNHEDFGVEDIDSIQNISEFTYESLEEKMITVADAIQKIDTDDGYIESDDFIEKDKWLEMLQNPTIFKEDDLVLLHKMYDLGGEASATRLAAAFGKHHASFNKPVVALARRIYKETNIEKIKREDGTVAYWRVLFNGRYETSNRFKWIMKDNLYNAFGQYIETIEVEDKNPMYTKSDFLQEVFVDDTFYETVTDLLKYKKNVILQGPPGVGKTFISKRLAYSLMGERDDARVEMVQFHQNYAYEDFIMGFRPVEGEGFGLEYGVFYDFCQKALANPEEDFYFIIDEINRGNLSKIFGELFMLIEGDKRDEMVTMGYSKEDFTVPSNIYLIGTMNTADRSLEQLEVAMRRRFAFITLEAQFNEKWQSHLKEQGVSDNMIEQISTHIERINTEISNDFQLGPGYEIGHSFFTRVPDHMDEHIWFQQVMRYEIQPLLEEYFFDRPEMVITLMEGVLHGTNI